ncbi:MAG: hypothetical protein JNK72_02480 [Myxococcales bacterium]|nr:hypothetical protein [Myxococcales bacterium]
MRSFVPEQLEALVAQMASQTRPIKIVPKANDRLQRAIDWALRVVTLGGQDRYLSEYVTTLGRTIYVPEGWGETPPIEQYKILRHELVHVAQFERYGWVGMVLVYGVVFLPMGLAWGRARLEWEAYAETLRVTAEVEGLAAAQSPRLRASIVSRFTGPDYAYMWPFPRQVAGWIDAELRMLEEASRG